MSFEFFLTSLVVVLLPGTGVIYRWAKTTAEAKACLGNPRSP